MNGFRCSGPSHEYCHQGDGPHCNYYCLLGTPVVGPPDSFPVGQYGSSLPFGLRSAPKIFTAVADGLAWALACEGIENSLHYLDDFYFCGPASSLICVRALESAIPLCGRLGLPVAPNKVEDSSTSLTFLGILIDSESHGVSHQTS